MIISFAWTSEALLAGVKTVTRRNWNDKYAERFKKGDVVDAYNKSPRYKGKKIAEIRLTANPYKQMLKDMPESHLKREGGLWKTKQEFIALFGDPELEVWVIEFELLKASEVNNEDLKEKLRKAGYEIYDRIRVFKNAELLKLKIEYGLPLSLMKRALAERLAKIQVVEKKDINFDVLERQ